jgi:hypothetical protein
VASESEARRRDKLSAITRELEAMSDWELERGCAASLGFDDDRRMVADRLLRERYAGQRRASRANPQPPGPRQVNRPALIAEFSHGPSCRGLRI